ncbi:MAG: capsule assembly Wzi family protein [Prevotella sp.]|nr:capsule assembly Wzi family protein [Prevotella sp.]
MRIIALILLSIFVNATAFPQFYDDDVKGIIPLADGLEYKVELQSTFSHGLTPLWLNANRYGLSSLENSNGYLRASIIRPLRTDSVRRWGIGYGVDLAVPYNFTSNFVVQQAFVEGRWLHGSLTVGSKEYPMELKNNRLSSGSQTLGINARPVPQVRIALPDYWVLPFGHDWLRLKGHIAYGMMTDQNWQHDFTDKQSKYADKVLYHSKAIYLKIGNEDRFYPFSIELGLEAACTFGGTAYTPDDEGNLQAVKGDTGIKAYLNALIFGGFDKGETIYKNVEGNQLGSWLIRLNWDEEFWRFSIYMDKYFEDQSAMFQLDYDGYGSGEEWNSKKKMRFLLYDFKDMMLGAELNLKNPKWVNDVVFEYIFTKYQSGPIYHDHTSGISDHIGGRDNFYNHGIYTGWQHWGQVIGNPLYRSPIYNTDGTISVEDNRFMAFHIGIDGNPTDNFTYRVLASYQDGLGTYDNPYDKKHHNVSFLVEGKYSFSNKLLHGWSVKGGYGMDFGKILGNNLGFQITIAKVGHF